MIQIKKTILTLALLALTAQAWAQTETLLTTITATAKEQASYSTANVATVSFSYTAYGSSAYKDDWGWWGYGWIATVTAAEGYTITKCIFYDDANRTATDSEAPFVVETTEEDKTPRINGTPIDGGKNWSKGIKMIEVYGYVGYVTPAASGPTVAWDKASKTGTFTMPGGNVTLEPEYYPQATAAEGAVTAADADARATTDDPLVKVDDTKLTGATKLMYFVSNSGTTAPAYDAEGWTDQLPTAEGFTEAGIVYVWYYPVGTDEGDADATATYSDGDICLQSITARIAPEPTYAVTFKAANANTIEAGKATVTVGGTAATVTEGKLQGVKMGSEVKLKANTGYKFRKVEVKKAAAAPSLNITNPVVGQVIGSDGKNYAADATLPSGVTAVAMIAYVGSETDDTDYTGGLAIALSDEGRMNWSTAKSTCEGKTAVTGAKWCLPSQNQWKAMFKANGGSESSYTGLNTAISTAGGTALQKSCYWSSTEHGEVNAYYVYLFSGNAYFSNASKGIDYLVRAVLAF